MLFEIVRKLSEQRGENLKSVSRKLGLSENAIYKWKTQSPNIDNVKKVAEYFNVSLDYLTGFNREQLGEIGESEIQSNLENLSDLYDEYGFELEHENNEGIDTINIIKHHHGTVKSIETHNFLENGTTILNELREKYSNDEEIHTIAAHHDGEEWTDEELEEIERFKEFVKSRRKQQE